MRKKSKAEFRLLCELNRVTEYLAAVAVEYKLTESTPDGFRDSIRDVIEAGRETVSKYSILTEHGETGGDE